MKLRITRDSIRLRLKQSEVRTLASGEAVAESCAGLLSYSLRPVEADEMRAHQSDGGIAVEVPRHWLEGWETSERVGFESNPGGLQILIEKDWKCVNPSNPKDNEDCYENPAPVC